MLQVLVLAYCLVLFHHKVTTSNVHTAHKVSYVQNATTRRANKAPRIERKILCNNVSHPSLEAKHSNPKAELKMDQVATCARAGQFQQLKHSCVLEMTQ